MKELSSISELEKVRQEVARLKDREIREMSYDESMDRAVKELEETDVNKIPTWGWKELEDVFWFLERGQLYVVWWVTGTGKSTFINQICQNVSMQGFRVSYYSLEDRLETLRKNDLYFECNRVSKKYWWQMFSKVKFMTNQYGHIPEKKEAIENLKEKNKNLYYLKHADAVSIKIIEEMIKEASKSWSKVIAIDHLHYFDMSENVNSDRHDLVIKDIMHRINKLARELEITILLVAHYKKLWKWEKPSLNEFSWSIAIAQVANWIIHLWRDKDSEFPSKTQFIIDKNRDMGITKTLEFNFDIETYEYKATKSETFKNRTFNL